MTNFSVFGQYNFDNAWQSIENLEKKGLYRKALNSVDELLQNAISEKNTIQIVKANFFQLKYNQKITEDDYVLGIHRIERLIEKSDIYTASILHSILAEVYFGYYSRNSWKFQDRTVLESDILPNDIRTWDLEKLAQKVIDNYQASLLHANELSGKKIEEYKALLLNTEKDITNNWTLYHFLANQAFTFFSQNSFNIEGPANSFTLNNDTYFKSNEAFANMKILTNDSFNLKYYAVEILQNLSHRYLKNSDLEMLFQIQLKRLKWAYDHSILNNKENLYREALNNMTIAYKDHLFVGEAWYELAQLFFTESHSVNLKTATEEERELRKKAVLICQQVIRRAPDSYGAAQCQHLISQINQKSLAVRAEEAYLPNQNNRLLIEYKNCQKAYIKVVEINHKKRWKTNELRTYMTQQKGVHESEHNLSGTEDYYGHSTEVLLPELEPGYYCIMIGSTNNFSEGESGVAFAKFWVTQLTYQTKENDKKLEVMAICRRSGHPLEGAEVKIKQPEYNRVSRKYVDKVIGTYKTDKNGKVEIKGLTNYKSYYISLKSGDDKYEPAHSIYYNHAEDYTNDSPTISLFTDRKLYRPGQTVYFKGIVTVFDGKKNSLKTGFKTTVKFLDVNYQEIKNIEVVSNEFGSFEGKFIAPYGVLTGQMTIQTPYGSTFCRVEEYKRPKFSASIQPLDKEYKINDEVSIKGIAESFAGSKISEATVKYRVQRTARFNYWRWWFRPSPSKEVTNGETVTNNKGEFEVKFKAIPDETIDPETRPIFNYTITVDVIDISGETRSATKTISLGYHSLVLSNTIDPEINAGKITGFKVMAHDLNGEEMAVKGTYLIEKLQAPQTPLRKRLWSVPDKQNWSKENFATLFPGDEFLNENSYENWPSIRKVQSGTFTANADEKIEFNDLSKWQAGCYKYTAKTTDKNGFEVQDEGFFTLVQPKSKKPVDNEIFKVISPEGTVKPGEKAQFIISTAAERLNVYYSIDFKGKTIKEEWLHLKKEQMIVDFPVNEEHIGNLTFDFLAVRDDRSYQQTKTISVPAPDHHLNISLESFRNKLLPGQNEEWTVVIRNAQNEAAQSELLATLYDASLDELFTKNTFNFSLRKPFYQSEQWSLPLGFGQVSGSNLNYAWNQYAQMPGRKVPILNHFGYSSSYYTYNWSRVAKGHAVMVDAAEEGFAPEPSMNGEMDELEAVEIKDSKNTMLGKAPAKPGELNSKQDQSKLEANENKATLPVKPRSNFNETAFFHPQLHTNEKGEIRIQFKMPESLTKWRFLGLAHSKTLEIGKIEKELVTQKDLMVLPNMPRFLREKDKITVSTKISNISESAINGTADISFIDPVSELDVTTYFIEKSTEQSFSVEADGNTQVSWTFNVPDHLSAVKYRIIAKSPKHADGEENVLPILSNRMLVTESMPIPMSGKGDRSFVFEKLKTTKSTSLKHHQLTLEFTSNPAWYALQAMPYMMEYPYECAEQTFTRYYANAIGTHVLNSKPKIKAIISQWRHQSPEAFLSNLNKNQELKSLMLEETPWVLNANDESETKRNLAVLLDLDRMNNELNKALSKIIKAQSASGGWAWFPGMKNNRYITQYIITGLGHLDVLGIADVKNDKRVKQMLVKGINYLDREIVRDFEQLKKYHGETYLKKNHIGYTQIQYLYMRSYFKDIKMNKATETAVTYYKSQAETYWLEFNIYARGMIGLAAKRMGMHNLSDDIYNSLKDNAIIDDEFGMYWKSYTSGYYWYQAPVETQALMIEFFNEMDDLTSVEQLKMWLLKEKQTTHWKTTKQTSEAVYALLLNGIDLLETNSLAEITIGGKPLEYVKEPSTDPYKVKPEAGTGYIKTKWNTEAIHQEMANINVKKSTSGPAWGAMYWQYFEDLDRITFAKTLLELDKAIYKVVLTDRGEKLVEINDQSSIQIGDKIRVRIELRTDRNLEYVHMKDMRAVAFEPINTISSYKYKGGLGYYEATKDAATNFFFDYIPKGTYVFEYDLRAEQFGNFSNGIATIQCMYAPEFTSHSDGIRVSIK